jgi:A/G-specific adenine glycosylase
MIGSRADMSRRLIAWYRRNRRDLPWRVPPAAPAGARPDPYHVLVSEAMLQQTQVATVVGYFLRFIETFPTIQSLADADEQKVLRLWQGLGYYSRARNLRAAAQAVVEHFDGAIPADLEQLRTLPGVGRYTAGAIASLAFDRRAAIVDGNVARVLCRIDRIESDPRERKTAERLWCRALQLLPDKHVSDFNSAMMELGATVCTPRVPKCLLCPVQAHCEAFAAGQQDRIPRPRAAKTTPLLRRRTWCIRRASEAGEYQWLIEQRPAKGRWAGMWQFVTRPARTSAGAPAPPLATRRPIKLGLVRHALTHRRYQFEVYLCDAREGARSTLPDIGRWVELDQLNEFPLPRPHVRIAQLLAERIASAVGGPTSQSSTI